MRGKGSPPPVQRDTRLARRTLDSGGWRIRNDEAKKRVMIPTNSENDVKFLLTGQFRRDVGAGGGSRGHLGKNRDGLGGEGNDDDQYIEARPEEPFADPWHVGHDLGVFGDEKASASFKKVQYGTKEGNKHANARSTLYTPRNLPGLSSAG